MAVSKRRRELIDEKGGRSLFLVGGVLAHLFVNGTPDWPWAGTGTRTGTRTAPGTGTRAGAGARGGVVSSSECVAVMRPGFLFLERQPDISGLP